MLTILLGLCSWQMSAQTVVEIPTTGGTSGNSYLPSYSFYNYSLTQQIYTANEIGMPGTISSVAFYNSGSEKTRIYTIYMVNTDKATFTGSYDWITVTDGDQVFTGNVTMASSTWTTINLDVPFFYDGSSNLALIVDDNTGTYSSGLSCYVFDAPSMALRVYSDGTNYNPMSPTSYSGTVMSVKNHIKLGITPGVINCHHVGTVTASNITSNDAMITWNTPEDAGTYILQYKPSVQDWNSSAVVTEYPLDTTYSFAGALSAQTLYDVRVANLCGNGDTSLWRSVSFKTACDEISQIPFSEDFNSYGTGEGNYPDCWTKINTYSADRPYVNSTAYEGGHSLYFYAGSSGTYNVAITPPFAASIPINTLQANFMYRANAASDRLIVGVMDDFTDITTFVPVDTVVPAATATAWDEKIVSFANYAGTGQYIAFRNDYTTTSSYAYIDLLVIETIPTCAKPTELSLSNYTVVGCDVDWQPNGSESAWEVVAVPTGTDVNNGTPESAYTHPYTLTNLSDNTTYDVYVRANCGSEVSGWSLKKTFSTNPLCTSPLNVTTSQVTGTSALVNWNSALYGATAYTVGYSEAGLENWTTVPSVTGNSYMISDLDSSTDYDVFVLSECDAGNADTVFTSLTTHCLMGGDPFTEGTISTYYIPLNNYYNYTYTQQIFLASEMGGSQTIDSIAFEYGYSTASTDKTNVTIYLGHTTQSTFSSTSNYISPSGLQQVYSGNLNCSQGWNTFVLSTPFQYNGTDNLVLVVDDNSGSYNGSSYTFLAHNAGAVRSVYYYSDSTNPTPDDPTSGSLSSSTSSNRSNVKFFNPCDNTLTCVAPNPYVTAVTENSISVSWAPGLSESSWEVESSTDNMTWTSEGTATTTDYTLNSLASNTLYYIRVRSICGGGEYSNWMLVSARTECSSVGLPYSEDFESAPGNGSGNMVYCWTTGTNSTSAQYPYTSSTQHYNGSYSAYFYGTSAYYSYLASPELDASVDMTNLQVRFYAYKSTASYYIQVGIMTDPNDPSTFVQVGQNLTPSATSTWEMLDVNTDSYTGTGRYVAFRIPAAATSYMYVDDITIDVIPLCLHVNNIQAANITTTTADLSWTAGGDETEWAVVYGPAGSIANPDNETALTASGTPEITLSNLSPSTAYDVYVKAVCSGSESSFWWPYSFNTLCGEISTLPLMENFDNMGSGSADYPNCWLRHNNYSTSTNYPYVSTSYHASGNASLYFYSSSSTYNYAVLPAMDVNIYPINTLQVSFQMRSTSSATTSSIQVGVMTDSSDVSTFVPVQTVHNSTTSVFEPFEVPLTSYTGTGRFIALKLVNTSGTYSIYLDDLMVDLAPLCDKPTNVIATNLTADGADIDWMPGGNETDWEVVVVPAGASITAGTPEQTNVHPYTLTDLSDNTAYDVYVRADCGTGVDFSSWSLVCHFSTTPLCSAPTDVTVSQIAGTSALLTWTPAVFGATGYTVAYTETGMDSWTTQSVTGNSYMLSGLTPETPYTVTITSECDEGAAPVITKTFTTSCLYGGVMQVGNGTSGNYHLPLNTFYNYSYTQQLYLANEINTAGDITSIAFQYIYSTSQTKSNQSIYLAETDLTTLSSWIPFDSLTLVYNGTVSYNNNGTGNWVTIPFTTPFNYSGNRNLVVVVKNDDGNYTTSSNNTFNVHSKTGMTLEYYDDDAAFSFTSPESPSTYSYRNNIRLGLACDPSITCIAPNAHVSDVTESSITVDWAPGNNESSWEVEYNSETDSTWVSQGTITTPSYTLNNLQPSTLYNIRLRSVCGGGEYSNWTTVSQRTECALIATLPYTENFDTWTGATTTTSVADNNLPYCWSYYNEGTSTSYSGYPIVYTSATFAASGSNSMRFYTYTTAGTYDDQTAILPPVDVNTLPINTMQISFDARALSTSYPFTLEIGVMTDPTNINTFMTVSTITTQSTTYANYEIPLSQYAGTGAYVAIRAPQPTTDYNYGYVDNVVLELIPSCPTPTQVHAVSTTTTSVELGWTENGTASTWIIEYDSTGFTSGSGTVVTANTNPFTISGLNASTLYDFYVKADCGGGDQSNYANVFTSATECEPISQLPYTENFDGVSGATTTSVSTNNLPLCWNNLNQGTSTSYSGYPIVYSSSTYAASGSNAMRFYTYTTSGTYDDQMAILPEIDVNTYPMNTLQVSFDARNNSTYTFTLVIGVISNPSDKTTFVPVDTLVINSGTYANYEFPLSNYTGTGHYIALMAPRPASSFNSGYVDNIEVGFIPSCPRPHDLHALNATVNSVELGWTEVGSATSWEIAYGAPGFDPDDASEATVVTANTNPFTLSNLADATTYDFYVRSTCSSTEASIWSAMTQGATTMIPVALPYTADFSTNDAWVLNNGNCTNQWTKGTVDNTGALFVTDNGTTPNYNISATSMVAAQKLFTVGTADSVTITFDVQVQGESSYDYMKLFLAPATTQFPASTSTPSLTDYGYNTYSTNAYNFYAHNYGGESSSYPCILNQVSGTLHVTATMPNPNANPNANSTALLVFAWKNDGSVGTQPPATIQNLSVTTNGSGPGPGVTDPTVATNAATAIAQTTATLNATVTNPDNVTLTAKGFEWKATSGGTYTQIAGTGTGNGFTANLTGLTPSTNYTYKAFITYNGTTVYGSEMTFTTLEQGVEPCNVPTGLTASDVQGESVTLTWDNDANVSSWNIQYRPEGGQLSTATSTTNSYTITGLTDGTTYQIQVQANCGDGNLSDWSSAISVTTTGIANWLESSVTLFPNPAKEVVNVQCTMYNVQLGGELYLFDVYGKLLQIVPITSEITPINVSGLANGMYFVRVTTEEGTVTKTFVKR